MAWECEEPNGVMGTICPLHGRSANGAANDDRAARPDQVNWAGLPINLDFAFSREQRDKVYVQHVMRKQGRRLGPWLQDGAQPCICEVAADHQHVRTDAGESISRQ
jgi:hypothetical protein